MSRALQWSSYGNGYSASAPTEEQHYAQPYDFTANATRRGMVFCHGHGALAQSGVLLSSTLTRAGLPALTPDLGGGATWGNDTAIARMTDAKAYLDARGCKTDKMAIMALSMGALSALNWARQNPSKVSALALILPCTDVRDIHDNNIGSFATEIETAYGGSSPYATALPTHNPIQYAASLSGIPMAIYYSTDDPTVRPATVTAFASATGVTPVALGAFGHTTGSWDYVPAANFLAAYM